MASRSHLFFSLVSCRGASITGWLLIIVVALILLQLVFKIVPAYTESYAVSEVLKSTAQTDDFKRRDRHQIFTQIRKGFLVNDVGSDVANALLIKRFDQKIHIVINYEKLIPIVKNVSLVISFEHFLDSYQPEKCCSPP